MTTSYFALFKVDKVNTASQKNHALGYVQCFQAMIKLEHEENKKKLQNVLNSPVNMGKPLEK